MTKSAYIHIPFCKSKCKYCSFVSYNRPEMMTGYVYSLLKDISENYRGEELKTLYFGGGTPSLLPVELLEKIIKPFIFSKDYEFTLEINPDDRDLAYFKQLKSLGVNRLSIGSQTFDDKILKLIGRRHNSEQITEAVNLAKEAGCIITFDPNLRPPLWKSLEDARVEIEYGMSKCDVLKISDNEVEFMCGTTDYDKGAAMIQEKYNIPLILITMGKDGSRAYYKDMIVEAAPFLQENTIETTGAGDTFCASTLNYVLDHGLENLTEENLKELLTFANAAASLITTRKGALRVMPTREEVESFIASRK